MKYVEIQLTMSSWCKSDDPSRSWRYRKIYSWNIDCLSSSDDISASCMNLLVMTDLIASWSSTSWCLMFFWKSKLLYVITKSSVNSRLDSAFCNIISSWHLTILIQTNLSLSVSLLSDKICWLSDSSHKYSDLRAHSEHAAWHQMSENITQAFISDYCLIWVHNCEIELL